MSKVIKRSSIESGDITPDTGFAEPTAKRSAIISHDRYEARSDAQSIREKAVAEAEEIRHQAEAEAVQLRQQANDQGYQQGYNEGKQAAASELSQIVAKSSQRLQHIEAQAIPQLRDLAITIARKIIGRELEFHPDAVVDIVKSALAEKARQRREIFLRVHPDDLEIIRSHKPDLLEVLSRAKEISIREDPDVARHGVIIETDAGIIDAQLDTQLDVFERVLRETR